MTPDLIIFDCDGVLIDSELIACGADAEELNRIGYPITADEVVRRYLATADVCLSPDPYTPLNDLSTMNKIMDYMAFGKPTVSFDLREARVSAGDSAVYVPCGDDRAFGEAIVSLVDDPQRRETMGIVGRQRIETELAWDHQERHLLAAYAKALA